MSFDVLNETKSPFYPSVNRIKNLENFSVFLLRSAAFLPAGCDKCRKKRASEYPTASGAADHGCRAAASSFSRADFTHSVRVARVYITL